MLTVYLIRHGQAGSRQQYDRLSGLGREQAARLGTWLAARKIRFSHAWSGRLQRQRETAEKVRAAAGADFPEIVPHSCWDEFDLDAVYRGIAPQLAADDRDFACQYEELKKQMRDPASRIHRAWSPCDTTVVRAWVDHRYDYEGESFAAFADRVRGARAVMLQDETAQNVAVFTSATPAAVWAGMALDLDPRRIMQLAGVTYNTALTMVRVDRERVRLFQFNTVPHLDDPDFLTHR